MGFRKFGTSDDQLVTLDDESKELQRTATRNDWTADEAKSVEREDEE